MSHGIQATGETTFGNRTKGSETLSLIPGDTIAALTMNRHVKDVDAAIPTAKGREVPLRPTWQTSTILQYCTN
jgi:hypothetical protein